MDRFPAQLVESASLAVHSALATSTRTTYAAGLLRFTQFCDRWDISEADRMPASYFLLCAFIADFKGRVSGGTVRSWLSGIRQWHLLNHAPWHGDDDWVHLARVAANKEGAIHRRPLRSPISLEHLHALRSSLDVSRPHHAAVWAAATCAFFGCRRLGEVLITSVSGFDPAYHVTRRSSVAFKVSREGVSSASFSIPWTKTTRESGATVVLTARHDALCPVAALRNHISVNASVDADAPMFAFVLGPGSWSHLPKPSFLSFCGDIWRLAALHHVHGHSFRIGGAVELLLAGVPPEVVAATGGWTSLAFLLYWRRVDEILPRCTSKAYSQSNLKQLACILEQFRSRHNIPSSFLTSSSLEL
ncbi:hypothetical protein EST38_g9773 [Candolleomyces aberdarensis]|uniref:DNA breaking-rejoining enzyme n=1 Tax=Candolleomyces aberdarensis TaxID=2316362 RepID=A0A4Q2DBA4_9AGAR|nr:hypothetical protein EST38_g9773 [Candolleomyces aberdarensis]